MAKINSLTKCHVFYPTPKYTDGAIDHLIKYWQPDNLSFRSNIIKMSKT
jgi:hypothetical protein